jgi:hypothetical protein
MAMDKRPCFIKRRTTFREMKIQMTCTFSSVASPTLRLNFESAQSSTSATGNEIGHSYQKATRADNLPRLRLQCLLRGRPGSKSAETRFNPREPNAIFKISSFERCNAIFHADIASAIVIVSAGAGELHDHLFVAHARFSASFL